MGTSVKFTVTPLGGSRSDIGNVVDGIVRYLQPKNSLPQQTPSPAVSTGGPEAYYADDGEEPGRWLGTAANASGLTGLVVREDFAAVLSGRDPATGERLITAQGSTGRRDGLGAGTATRTGSDGLPLYGAEDAAAALGLTIAEVELMLDHGEARNRNTTPNTIQDTADGGREIGRVRGREIGHEEGREWPNSGDRGSYLTPGFDSDGTRWITETELTACETARATGVDPETVRDAGLPTDQLPIAEAARISGLTAQYLRRLAKYHDDNRLTIQQSVEAGRRPRKAYLEAHRGTRQQWLVSREHLVEFLQRRQPPSVRVGFDLTLTTEKSLGVLAMLADPDVGRTVLGSIQDANDWAIGWLEGKAAYGRISGQPVKSIGWTVASFRHLTSRALDPFPHHHNVIANSVTLPDGSRRGLDTRGLYRHAHAASALSTAEMRHQLTTLLGVRWRPARHGGWEIDGITDDIVREFSRRRNEIDDALAELETEIGRGHHPNEISHIVLQTRPAKTHTPPSTLIAGWRQRAEQHGLNNTAISSLLHRETPIAEPDLDAFFESLAGSEGICAGGSVFTSSDALVALANHPIEQPDAGPQPLLVGAGRLEEVTSQFLTSSQVIQVAGGDQPLFTTREILGVQERITKRFTSGLHRGAHLVSATDIDLALAAHPHLTSEQQHLARSWCAYGHRFQTAIGRAGAGKTTTVAACAQAWTTAGYKVLGAAVKGEAARTLAAATDIECETVAWYLTHDDPQNLPLDSRTILVVDEASTLSDRDLDTLMTMAATTGASVRLIGDPAQHGAIAAGGMFRVLCERNPKQTPELRTTHRVKDTNDRGAAEALREGRIDDALTHLEDAGHLHIVGDDLTMYRQILSRWWDAERNGQQHPMVDRRNTTRRQLNRLAHLIRQTHGDVGTEEIIGSGDRRFSVGDRITARAPNRQLHPKGASHAYVRNGALGTITKLHPSKHSAQDLLEVEFDDVGTIEIPRSFFDHHTTSSGNTEVGIDHAYALTSYAVQGSTRYTSTSRIDATTTRAETYVDITRGRDTNHLYLTATTDPLDGEILPRTPNNQPDEAVTHRLQRSTSEITAWELAHPPNQHTSSREKALGL